MITAKQARKTTEEVNKHAALDLSKNFDEIKEIVDSFINSQCKRGACSLVLTFDGKPTDPSDGAVKDVIHELWLSGLKSVSKVAVKQKREFVGQVKKHYESLGFNVNKGARNPGQVVAPIIIRWDSESINNQDKKTNKTNFHKVEVRNKGPEGKVLTGANTEVLIDGKPVKGCNSLKFEVGARNIAKVNLELYADVEIEGEIGKFERTIIPVSSSKEANK